MKSLITVCGALFLLPCVVFGGEGITLYVTSTNTVGLRRKAIVDFRLPDGVSISKAATLLVIVGVDKQEGPPDEFGPPQNFALKGTGWEIAPGHFRVSVALPNEKVAVRFMLRDDKRVLLDEKRTI